MRTCHSLWCQENWHVSVGLAPARVKIRASACSFRQRKSSTKITPAYSLQRLFLSHRQPCNTRHPQGSESAPEQRQGDLCCHWKWLLRTHRAVWKSLESIFPSPSPSNAEKGKMKVKEKKKYLKSNLKKKRGSFESLKLPLRVCKTEATSAKHLLTSEQQLTSSSHPYHCSRTLHWWWHKPKSLLSRLHPYHCPNSTEKQPGATWASFSPPHVPPEETSGKDSTRRWTRGIWGGDATHCHTCKHFKGSFCKGFFGLAVIMTWLEGQGQSSNDTVPQLGDRMSVTTTNPLPLLVILPVLMYLQLLNCIAVLNLNSSFMLATAAGIERCYKRTEKGWICSIPKGAPWESSATSRPSHCICSGGKWGFHPVYLLELIHTFINPE